MPAENNALVCPFSGQPIEIVVLGGAVGHDLGYMARVKWPGGGGYATSVFGTREELLHALRMRGGVPAPGSSPEAPRIEVRELTPPAADAFEDQRSRMGELEDATKDFVDRVIPRRRARRTAVQLATVPG